MRQVPAVIVGLDSMQGLQVARILAARGVPVYGISKSRDFYANKTRVCEEIVFADTGGDELIETLLELSARFGEQAVLIPCQDNNVLLTSRHRQALAAGYHIRLPSPGVVEDLTDKARFAELAADLDIPIPVTFEVTDRRRAAEIAEWVTYPVVVKPPNRSREWLRHTKNRPGGLRPPVKAIRARTPKELMRIYDSVGDWVESLLIQQWIDGTDADLYSFNGYFDEQSKPLVTFMSRKIRQYPPEMGQSCLGEEVRADEVLETSLRLFTGVGMVGLAYLEMKRDRRDGRYYAVEPNIGRPTGRGPIAEAGGVELHYTAYCDAAGLPLPGARVQTYGHAKWIHLLRDIQSASFYYRRDELTLREWFRSVRGHKAYAIASWRDPYPFLAALGSGVGQAVSRQSARSDRISA